MATAENRPDPDASLDPALPQKKRARRRLVGAIALCLAAVIVFPLLFEQEPHRGNDEVKVQIPSRDTPLPAPGVAGGVSGAAGAGAAGGGSAAGGSAAGSAASGGAPAAGGTAAGRSGPPGAGQGGATAPGAGAPPARADGKAEPRNDGRAAPRANAKADQIGDQKADQKPASRADAKASSRSDSKPEAKSEPKAADSRADAKADRSRRDGKAAGDGKRYLLQVGAFATEKGAADQAAKVRAAGLAVFTEKVHTAQGDRIRVRVGPFSSREQADQARGQLKLVGIDSALIAP